MKEVLDQIQSGAFSPENPDLFKPLVQNLLTVDQCCLLADFQSYLDSQREAEQVYLDGDRWTTLSILNAARSGYFSADRAIREYCQHIWNAEPVSVNNDVSTTMAIPINISMYSTFDLE